MALFMQFEIFKQYILSILKPFSNKSDWSEDIFPIFVLVTFIMTPEVPKTIIYALFLIALCTNTCSFISNVLNAFYQLFSNNYVQSKDKPEFSVKENISGKYTPGTGLLFLGKKTTNLFTKTGLLSLTYKNQFLSIKEYKVLTMSINFQV